MRAISIFLAIFCLLSFAYTASALSSMPGGDDPFPTVIFTVAVIALIVGLFATVRYFSRRHVEMMRKNGDFEGLIKALKNPLLARNAARSLGESKDPRAIGPLVAALEDRDEDIRCAAARALGEIGDVQAKGPLERALQDQYKAVRDCASFAIKRLHEA